jgi:hypothetical protein
MSTVETRATNTFCWSFQDPDEIKDADSNPVNLCYPSYIIKKGIAIMAYFTDGPTAWATVVQPIIDYIMPFFAKLANGAGEVNLLTKSFSTTFQVIGIGEHVNDLHYFLNGAAYKDCKKTRIGSLFAHILSVPIHWISTSVFLKAVNLAETIGQIRIFSWAAKAGTALQSLPLLSSIPKIAEAGQWLSQVQVFKWIPAIAAYSTIADGALCGVSALYFADGLHRFFHSKHKIEKGEDKYKACLTKDYKFTKEQIDSLLIEKKIDNAASLSFSKLNEVDRSQPKITQANQIKLGRLRVKLLNQQNKQFQAKVDVIAAVAQFVLQVALVIGLASMIGLLILGAFALLAGGASLYYKATLKKPDLDSVLL